MRTLFSLVLFGIIFLALNISSFAQTITCKLGRSQPYQRRLIPNADEESDASKIVGKILKFADQSPGFAKVQAADVANAEVCFAIEKTPAFRILFSPTFFATIEGDKLAGWAKTAILAHEVAHLLNQDLTKEGFRINPKLELAADDFAGAFLAAYGIALQDAKDAYNSDTMKIGGEANTSYPPIDERVSAIDRGWRRIKDPELVWGGNHQLLAHNYGKNVDGVWVSQPGEALEGNMIDGPSVLLKSGAYKLTFLFRCKKDEVAMVGNDAKNAIRFLVASTKETNSDSFVALEKCNDSIRVESWVFIVSEVSENANARFDFRVFSYRNAEIRVKEIKVEKVVTF